MSPQRGDSMRQRKEEQGNERDEMSRRGSPSSLPVDEATREDQVTAAGCDESPRPDAIVTRHRHHPRGDEKQERAVEEKPAAGAEKHTPQALRRNDRDPGETR